MLLSQFNCVCLGSGFGLVSQLQAEQEMILYTIERSGFSYSTRSSWAGFLLPRQVIVN